MQGADLFSVLKILRVVSQRSQHSHKLAVLSLISGSCLEAGTSSWQFLSSRKCISINHLRHITFIGILMVDGKYGTGRWREALHVLFCCGKLSEDDNIAREAASKIKGSIRRRDPSAVCIRLRLPSWTFCAQPCGSPERTQLAILSFEAFMA